MHLEVAEGIGIHARVGQSFGVQTELANRAANAGEQLVINLSYQGAAADERYPESHSFFVRESEHFNREVQRAAGQLPNELDSEDHAENAVKRTRMRYRVQVRSDVQDSRSSGIAASNVARRVD